MNRTSTLHRVHVVAGGASPYLDLTPDMPRAKFEFEVEEADALRDALAPAIARLEEQLARQVTSMPFLVSCVGVGSTDDFLELGQGFVVGADGRVRASLDRAREPFGDLVRAHALGLLERDPHVVRVWIGVPAAGAGGAAWEAFRAAVEAIWPTVEHIGVGYAAYQATKDIAGRLRAGLKTLIQHGESLEQRSIAPADVVRLIHARVWNAEDLARALDVPIEDAVTLLQGLGFVRDDNRRWIAPQGPSSDLIKELFGALTGYEAAVGDIAALRHRFNEAVSRAETNRSG